MSISTCYASRHAASAVVAFRVPGVTASAPSRTISGLVSVWGQVGNTSIGPVVVPGPEAVTLPADLSRIKLVDGHDPERPVSIGYATAAEVTPQGLRMSFRVAATPAGDAALLEAVEGARDAFSFELSDLKFESDGLTLAASVMTATALVVVPAFADARVDSVAASHNPPKGKPAVPMTPEQRARLAELIAKTDLTDAERAELDTLTAAAIAEMAAAPEAPAEPAAEPVSAVALASARASLLAGHAAAPASLRGSGSGGEGRDISELYAAMARVATGTSRPELEAALSDITSTANIWATQDAYAGQLWSGVRYKRRWVDLMTPGKLTSYKGTGWRWVVKPEVADYAGDKAAVTSNEPTTEAAPYTAARLAGAHDIDRKFRDFGDTEFFAAYYDAMTESYAMKSDAKAAAFLIAGVSETVAAGAVSIFRAIAEAAVALDDNVGMPPDWVLISRADWLDLLDITDADIPAYLDLLGVDLSKLRPHTGLAAGTVEVGVKAATTFYELSETPIRVETVDLANGGIDGGVFGYYATLENNDGGRVKATFGA